MTSHLVIPDPHAKPGVNNNRFEWAANFALKHRPDVIIQLGDWADMPSLSSYDKGKKTFEGRRYLKDIKAGRDAYERFMAPINEHNRKHYDSLDPNKRVLGDRRAEYHPRLIALGGNHDQGRIDRVMEMHSEMDGLLSVDDLGAKEFGWEYVPFKESIKIDGINYSHFFPSGVMGRPIGGEHPASTLLAKMHQSVTVGHLHLRDFSERTRADGKKICGLMSGCYFDHKEEWAGAAQKLWWAGLILCNDIKDGYYDPHFYRLSTLKKEYS